VCVLFAYVFPEVNPSPQSMVPEYVPAASYGNVMLSFVPVVLNTLINAGRGVVVTVGVGVGVDPPCVGVIVGVIVVVGGYSLALRCLINQLVRGMWLV